MSAPSYRWVCHRCAKTNPPGLAACEACGFQAVASGKEIVVQPPKPEVPHRPPSASLSWNDAVLFFPEVIPAALVAAASPVWLVSLLAARQFLAALVLLVGVAAGVGAFITGVQGRNKWLAYAGVVMVIVAAYCVHSLGQ